MGRFLSVALASASAVVLAANQQPLKRGQLPLFGTGAFKAFINKSGSFAIGADCPATVTSIRVRVVGGGGSDGTANAWVSPAPATGVSASFGNLISATAGAAPNSSTGAAGAGGVGYGGDFQASGGPGGAPGGPGLRGGGTGGGGGGAAGSPLGNGGAGGAGSATNGGNGGGGGGVGGFAGAAAGGGGGSAFGAGTATAGGPDAQGNTFSWPNVNTTATVPPLPSEPFPYFSFTGAGTFGPGSIVTAAGPGAGGGGSNGYVAGFGGFGGGGGGGMSQANAGAGGLFAHPGIPGALTAQIGGGAGGPAGFGGGGGGGYAHGVFAVSNGQSFNVTGGVGTLVIVEW